MFWFNCGLDIFLCDVISVVFVLYWLLGPSDFGVFVFSLWLLVILCWWVGACGCGFCFNVLRLFGFCSFKRVLLWF